MNRAEKVRAIAAYEALAAGLRTSLADAARDEIEREGTVPTWRSPGIAVSVSTSHPAIAIVGPEAFLGFVKRRWPSEVYTVHQERVREAWQQKLIAEALLRGDPPCTADGEVIPGLEYRAGGAFRSVSITPERETKKHLARVAAEFADGRRELPSLEPFAREVEG